MSVRLLGIGDIHLGRLPSRVPAEFGNPRDLSPIACWQRSITWAIEHDVDAVVLLGDVIEDIHDRFEAYPYLAEAMGRLTDAGIRVVAVSGNHDVEALPRLARQLPDLTLLGPNGVWTETIVAGKDGSQIRLLGWSFPADTGRGGYGQSPVAQLVYESSSLPTIGLLHADVNASQSKYAPVAMAELEAVPVNAWLLGHIHRPDSLIGQKPIGYLGSLVGLDVGEPGQHGPWLIEVEESGKVVTRHLPLAPMRWEELRVDISSCGINGTREDVADAIHSAMIEAMEELNRTLEPELQETSLVACRIYLCGRCGRAADIPEAIDSLGMVSFTQGAVRYWVEKIINQTRPELNLNELAKGTDPVALLARKILLLEADGAEADSLLTQARTEIAAGIYHNVRPKLRHLLNDDGNLREILISGAYGALEQLYPHTGGGS